MQNASNSTSPGHDISTIQHWLETAIRKKKIIFKVPTKVDRDLNIYTDDLSASS